MIKKNIGFIILISVSVLSLVSVAILAILSNNDFTLTPLLISNILISSVCVLITAMISFSKISEIIRERQAIDGFGDRSHVMIRSGDAKNIIKGVLLCKKKIDDKFYFLIKDYDIDFITTEVPKKLFYMKATNSEVTVPLILDNLMIPGIVIGKFVEDEMFFIWIKNKWGCRKYSVDFDVWDAIPYDLFEENNNG